MMRFACYPQHRNNEAEIICAFYHTCQVSICRVSAGWNGDWQLRSRSRSWAALRKIWSPDFTTNARFHSAQFTQQQTCDFGFCCETNSQVTSSAIPIPTGEMANCKITEHILNCHVIRHGCFFDHNWEG